MAAVSPRPQTTQRRQLGILTLEDAQIIFMDTPGIHKPLHKLGEYMNDVAKATLEEADVLIWMVDASVSPHKEDRLIANFLKEIEHLPPTILVLNKIDLLSAMQIQDRQRSYLELFPEAARSAAIRCKRNRSAGFSYRNNQSLTAKPATVQPGSGHRFLRT